MRKLLFWLHLIAGVTAGLLILTMCVTGTLLTYERQIKAWADHRDTHFTVPQSATGHLPPEALLARVREANDVIPSGLTLYAAPDAPAEVPLGRDSTLFVNPYTGETLGKSATGTRQFFRNVENWHRWMGMGGAARNTGKSMMDAGNLVFFFIVVSGLYLWFPRKLTWKHFRPVLLFRGGLSGKARDFNWHNVIGIWAWVPLFFIVGSGVVMSYQWASNLVYAVTNSPLPAGEGRGENLRGRERPNRAEPDYTGLDRAWAVAEQYLPDWTSIRVQISGNPRAPLTFNLDQGDGGQPQSRGTLTLDRQTASVVSWTPFSASSPGQRVRMFLRFTHTGESLGIIGQTIAGLASAGGGVMVYTGIMLSIRRLLAWRRRQQRSPEVALREQEQLV